MSEVYITTRRFERGYQAHFWEIIGALDKIQSVLIACTFTTMEVYQEVLNWYYTCNWIEPSVMLSVNYKLGIFFAYRSLITVKPRSSRGVHLSENAAKGPTALRVSWIPLINCELVVIVISYYSWESWLTGTWHAYWQLVTYILQWAWEKEGGKSFTLFSKIWFYICSSLIKVHLLTRQLKLFLSTIR